MSQYKGKKPLGEVVMYDQAIHGSVAQPREKKQKQKAGSSSGKPKK